jgi:hypothetical protein
MTSCPNQKTILFVPAGAMKVTKIIPYKGKPEIKILSDDQWKW